MYNSFAYLPMIILEFTSSMCTHEFHIFSQYESSLKINLAFKNNSRQIGKRIIHLCTSAKFRIIH
jgi:hypothetical protein